MRYNSKLSKLEAYSMRDVNLGWQLTCEIERLDKANKRKRKALRELTKAVKKRNEKIKELEEKIERVDYFMEDLL